jgi:small GTP-binding protein
MADKENKEDKEKKEKIEYKIILLGNSAVGKTSLFKKIVTGEFSEKNISTIGMDRRTIQLEAEITENGQTTTKPFEISLVDTAGQERFRAITKTYFNGADCILLIYDVTNQDSFTNVKSWIESIHESIGDHKDSKYVIFLIGNKIDLIGVDGRERCVDEKEAKLKCEEFKILWGGECSAKTFSDNQLKDLIKGYVKHIYDKVGQKNVKQQVVKKMSTKKNKKRPCIFL